MWVLPGLVHSGSVNILKPQEKGVTFVMGVKPVLLDAGTLGPVTRNWTNYKVGPLSGLRISMSETLSLGSDLLWSLLKTPSQNKVFRTLLWPFPPGQPTEFWD